jgi:hypothetical protein
VARGRSHKGVGARGRSCSRGTRSHPPGRHQAGAAVPELPTAEVEQAVYGKYETFGDSSVRDFVPVLVEQASRRRLAEQRSQQGI